MPPPIVGDQLPPCGRKGVAHLFDRAGSAADIQHAFCRECRRDRGILGFALVLFQGAQFPHKGIALTSQGSGTRLPCLARFGRLGQPVFRSFQPGPLGREPGLQITHQVAKSREFVIRLGLAGLCDLLRGERTEAPDGRVPRCHGFAQPHLLAFDLGEQFGLLRFQHGQALDVGAVGGPDEVRQHVNVAERLPYADRAHIGVGQHGPIRAGYVTSLPRLAPPFHHGGLALQPGKLLEDQLMPLVERLVQQFRARIVHPAQANGFGVQLVVGQVPDVALRELAHGAAEFGGGQAGADDRAMDRAVQLPQFGTLAGWGRAQRTGLSLQRGQHLGRKREAFDRAMMGTNFGVAGQCDHGVASVLIRSQQRACPGSVMHGQI